LPTHDIIVIGGSAGALAALKRILRGLPPKFLAAIFVVIHASPIADAYEAHAEESETRAKAVRGILVTNDVEDRTEVRVKATSVREDQIATGTG
jgi:chemotaxis response regulator CheB